MCSAHPVLWICRRFSTVEPFFSLHDMRRGPFWQTDKAFNGLGRASSSFSWSFIDACSYGLPLWKRTPRPVLPVDKPAVEQSLRSHPDGTSACRRQHGRFVQRRHCGHGRSPCFFCRQKNGWAVFAFASGRGVDVLAIGSAGRRDSDSCHDSMRCFFFADKWAFASLPASPSGAVLSRLCRQMRKFLLFS